MGLISTAEDRRGRSVGAAARHARHVGRLLLCCLCSMRCIQSQSEQHALFTSSPSRVTASWARLQLRKWLSCRLQAIATLLNSLGFGTHPSRSFNTKNHKKMIHSSPRSYPCADHDLVMHCSMARAGSHGARRLLSACWPSLTRNPRLSTTCMKHTDPSTCRSKKEASVTYKGPLRQCIYYYTSFAAFG
jgi:hypothetical protein